MKNTIIQALENAQNEGFDNLHSDFENEADMNQFLTWAVNFDDRNTIINPPGSKSIGMPI